MPIYRGSSKPKFCVGSNKVKKIYRGATQVYSSGNVVTYNFNGSKYFQEYDEGQDVLHPVVVSPAISGATFLGWVNSTSATTPLTSLTMDSDPIVLYALFKWADTGNVITPGLRITFGWPTNNGNEILVPPISGGVGAYSGIYNYPMDISKYDSHRVVAMIDYMDLNNPTTGTCYVTAWIDGTIVRQLFSPNGNSATQTLVSLGTVDWVRSDAPVFQVENQSGYKGNGFRSSFYVTHISFYGKTTII